MEEDIVYFEEIIECFKVGMTIEFGDKDIEKLENLLTRYKQLEENQLWSEATLEGLKKDFIPKSKIKEKIEELEQKDFKQVRECNQHDNKALAQIQALQGLLKEE